MQPCQQIINQDHLIITQWDRYINHNYILMLLIRTVLILFLSSLASSKLYQVVSMFRHGARYHLNSLYDGNSTREMWEQLTAVGMKQHQNLGKFLKIDYIDNLQFLCPSYAKGEIQVFTTDTNRTFESAISQMYGLFPLGTGERLIEVEPKYHLPPFAQASDCTQNMYSLPSGVRGVPIYINDQIVMTDCKNYDKELNKNELRQLQTYKEMNLTYYPFLRKMAAVFNISASTMNLSKISSLYDTLTVDKYLGRPMPEYNFTEDDYLNLRHLHYWYNFFKISFDVANAINTGKVSRILQDFDDRIANLKNKTLKWTFLSAHDTDATAMLAALNISSAQCIEQLYRYGSTSALNCRPNQEYATNLIWQLHSDDQRQFYVKIRHEGEYVYLCERKQFTCQYSEWKDRIKKVVIDTDAVCISSRLQADRRSKRYESALQ